jgi:hypothetical protein
MTHPGDAELDAILGPDATPYEREELREVLAEVLAEEAAGLGTLEETGAALDDSYARNARRLAEDVTDSLDKRPTDEVKLARALDRIADGTYTPPAIFRPARDSGGRFGRMCGPLDDLGGCAARYHRPGCATLTLTDAPNASYEDAQSWNTVVHRHLPPAELASPGEPADWEPGGGFGSFEDLTGPPGGPGTADWDLHARVLHSMGLVGEPPGPRPPVPDTAWIREELGL